jgi:Domain of unknown function (DUF4105)
MRLVRFVLLLLGLVAAIFGLVFLWLAVGVHLSGPVVIVAQGAILLALVTVLWGLWRGRSSVLFGVAGGAALIVTLWWTFLPASNDRIWAPEYVRTLTASIDGDIVTLGNVRNFRWQTIDTAEEAWETRVFDASTIISVDVYTSVWGNPNIAHVMVSFGFEDGQHIAFSAETRRREGQVYSTLGGFVREFELTMLAADERDLIWLRTDLRGERVSLFPLTLAPEARRALFMAFAEFAEDLNRQPQWYNTLLDNCTTVPLRIVRTLNEGIPLDWRVLASGRLPAYLHDLGVLRPDLGLAEVEAKAVLPVFGPWPSDGIAYSQAIRAAWAP